MLHERCCESIVVVERCDLVEDRIISCLADIGGYACDEPERVIIESASDIQIAALCERLILMICGAVRELCCRDLILFAVEDGVTDSVTGLIIVGGVAAGAVKG